MRVAKIATFDSTLPLLSAHTTRLAPTTRHALTSDIPYLLSFTTHNEIFITRRESNLWHYERHRRPEVVSLPHSRPFMHVSSPEIPRTKPCATNSVRPPQPDHNIKSTLLNPHSITKRLFQPGLISFQACRVGLAQIHMFFGEDEITTARMVAYLESFRFVIPAHGWCCFFPSQSLMQLSCSSVHSPSKDSLGVHSQPKFLSPLSLNQLPFSCSLVPLTAAALTRSTVIPPKMPHCSSPRHIMQSIVHSVVSTNPSLLLSSKDRVPRRLDQKLQPSLSFSPWPHLVHFCDRAWRASSQF